MENKSSMTDADLVLKYQSGVKGAMPVLVKRWHLRFCRVAFWIVKDADVAKDITQESWVVIIQKIGTLQDPTKFKSWAISIINRKSIDFLRGQKREQQNLRKFHMNFSDAPEELIYDDGVMKDKKRIVLLDAINSLPKNQQIVLKLFYKEDYKLKEIGNLLSISIGTAKSRLFHAREKLKGIIKNKNYED